MAKLCPSERKLCAMLRAPAAQTFQKFVEESRARQSSMTFDEFVQLAQNTLQKRNRYAAMAGREAEQVLALAQGSRLTQDAMWLIQTELQHLQQPKEHVAVIFYQQQEAWRKAFVQCYEGDGASFAKTMAEWRHHTDTVMNHALDQFPWEMDDDGKSFYSGFWIGSQTAFDQLQECFQQLKSSGEFFMHDVNETIEDYVALKEYRASLGF